MLLDIYSEFNDILKHVSIYLFIILLLWLSILFVLILEFSGLKKKSGEYHKLGSRCILFSGKMHNIFNALIVQAQNNGSQPINMDCKVLGLLENSLWVLQTI